MSLFDIEKWNPELPDTERPDFVNSLWPVAFVGIAIAILGFAICIMRIYIND